MTVFSEKDVNYPKNITWGKHAYALQNRTHFDDSSLSLFLLHNSLRSPQHEETREVPRELREAESIKHLPLGEGDFPNEFLIYTQTGIN